jgi:predicted TIM-barrel fold metal-dependent hydrolase
MLPFNPNAFRMMSSWRPVEDAAASLICHGALSRFPDLKVAFIENGSTWVLPLMNNLKTVYKKMPQEFEEDPIEVLKRQIHVSPFWEEDLGVLADLIGPTQVLFGSDYPHPEGLANPTSYIEDMSHVPEETMRMVMGGNLARLMKVDATVAAA